jgi:lipoate-protein ligase B
MAGIIHPVHIHSALKGGCIPYTRGWAWQQLILNRRLEFLRSCRHEDSETKNDPPTHDFHPDMDQLLLFQHDPVYTLGSGSDEKHLTFLKGDEKSNIIKSRLSKANRGLDSARLLVDRLQFPADQTPQQLVDSFQPPSAVTSPSGVPIYRVERGGQVTFHGPGMLVVYPLLDLRRDPYKQDLHWYMRSIEEVIIRTLQQYNIVGKRDQINSGMSTSHVLHTPVKNSVSN